jgi:BA14K-like protein
LLQLSTLSMSTPKILTALATILAAVGTLVLFVQDSSFAQDAGPYGPAGKRPFLRRDLYYNARYYDGRDDQRDFPTNGFFPGDFAADPAHAAIGAAGLFGFTPEHAGARLADGYYQADCARRYRSYNPATGYFTGHDGTRHRCR